MSELLDRHTMVQHPAYFTIRDGEVTTFVTYLDRERALAGHTPRSRTRVPENAEPR